MKYAMYVLPLALAKFLTVDSFGLSAASTGRTTQRAQGRWESPHAPGQVGLAAGAARMYDRVGNSSKRRILARGRRRILCAASAGASSPSGGPEDCGSSGGNGGEIGDGAGGLSSNGAGGPTEEAEAAEPESLASLVESTFVLAAAGNSYQMGLKSFISTIKEAYERGYTVPALTMEVSFVPTKTAGRDLMPDEVELRSVWIALVYLTLENANWPQKVQRAHEISAPFMDRFSGFVKNVMDAAARGHTLQTLKLEEVMRRGAEPRTPMEAAVLSQSMRIVFATLDLMKEGWSG